jgi:SulP family sulfate permease
MKLASENHRVEDLRSPLTMKPASLMPVFVAGAVNTGIIVILALSFATLIFSGSLAPHLPDGISMALLGAVALVVVVALTSSFPGIIAAPQSASAAISALIAASIAGQLAAPHLRTGYITIVASIAISSLIVGLSMLALGWFRMGRLIRFIPYPVVGGFLAGTGWVLLHGSFGVMNRTPLNVSDLSALLNLEALRTWLPGLLLGAVLLLLVRRVRNSLVIPTVLVAAPLLFYGALALTGMSTDTAVRQGLMIGGATSATPWQPLLLSDLTQIDWALVAANLPGMFTMVVVTVISLLLNATGVELTVERHLDLNRELRACGWGNLASGLFGGIAGFQALTYTTLAYQLGARGRLTGLVTGVGIGLVFLTGNTVVALIPRFVLGGVLAFLGLQLLVTWLYDTRDRLTRSEYAIIVLIVIVTALFGYLPGVAVGLLATVGLFVFDYSRLSIVKNRFSGRDYQSKIIRSPQAAHILASEGSAVEILQLHGFIFFGTANSLVEIAQARMADTTQPPLRYLVLDFRRVTKIDSSAVLSFTRLRQVLHGAAATLVLTGVAPRLERQLDLTENQNICTVKLFPELDRGIAWCEDEILTTTHPQIDSDVFDLAALMSHELGASHAAALMRYLNCQTIAAGTMVARQGEPGDELFFIESGLLGVQLEVAGQPPTRVRTATAGSVLGEIGVFLQTARTASIVAERDSVIYRLSSVDMRTMQRENPALAAAFNAYMARVLAERLADTTAALQAVLA